jgi:hypothetical protein
VVEGTGTGVPVGVSEAQLAVSKAALKAAVASGVSPVV